MSYKVVLWTRVKHQDEWEEHESVVRTGATLAEAMWFADAQVLWYASHPEMFLGVMVEAEKKD